MIPLSRQRARLKFQTTRVTLHFANSTSKCCTTHGGLVRCVCSKYEENPSNGHWGTDCMWMCGTRPYRQTQPVIELPVAAEVFGVRESYDGKCRTGFLDWIWFFISKIRRTNLHFFIIRRDCISLNAMISLLMPHSLLSNECQDLMIHIRFFKHRYLIRYIHFHRSCICKRSIYIIRIKVTMFTCMEW